MSESQVSNTIISSSSTPAAARELSDPNLGECTGSEQSCKDNVAIVGDSSSAHVLDSSIPFEHNAGFNSPPESDIKHDASHVVVHPPADGSLVSMHLSDMEEGVSIVHNGSKVDSDGQNFSRGKMKGRERKNFSKEIVDVLQSWFYENISHP
jgi:hypothetical protein